MNTLLTRALELALIAVAGTATWFAFRLRRAESERRDADELFRQLIGTIRSAFWISTPDKSRMLYASPAYEQIFQHPVGELYSKPTAFLDRMHPDDRERVRNDLRRQADGEAVYEYRLLRPDGETRWIRTRTFPIRNARGETYRVAGITEDITEQKQSDALLRESEEKFRALAETMPAVAIIYQGTRNIYVNPAATAVTGYSRDELLGMDFWDVIHPEMRELVRTRGMARQSGAAVPRSMEVKLLTKQGEERWVEFSAGLVQTGGAPAVLGTALDISERKRAEAILQAANQELEARVLERTSELSRANEELRHEVAERRAAVEALHESQSQFRAVFELGRIGVGMAGVDLILTTVNPAFCEMLGYPAEELRGLTVRQITHPDDVEEDKRLMSGIFSGKHQTYQREKRYVRKDGEVIWGHVLVSAYRREDGQPLKLIAMVQNITKRKAAEERLRGSEERFRQLAENIHQIFWMASPELTEILYMSPAVSRVFGIQPQEAYESPQRLLAATVPEDFPLVYAMIDEMMKGPTDREYRIRRADGQIRWVHTQTFPVTDASGAVIRIAGLTEDVTARKLAEEEIRRYSEGLEKLIEIRTIRIKELERQRAQSEKLAATGSMAARIAHEINNPLGGILNSFLLIKDAVPPTHPYFSYVDKIEREIGRIARIVRLMFDVYRPEHAVDREIGFRELAEELVSLHVAAGRARGVTITVSAHGAAARARIPEGPVRQVLHNLIQNAIQASPPGGSVAVGGTIVEGQLRVTVADQGTGIPEEIATRVFEPFFTTKTGLPNEGLGLGLSVSKSMVESLRGTIGFTSIPGRGTTFHVALPFDAAAHGVA